MLQQRKLPAPPLVSRDDVVLPLPVLVRALKMRCVCVS